jgi:hypothetical protein
MERSPRHVACHHRRRRILPIPWHAILAHPTAASVVSAHSLGHNDEEEDLPPISKTPLFGTLSETRPTSRNVRR